MLIFLYGEETFLVKKKLRELISYHQTKYPTRVNFFRLDARETTPLVFFDAVRQSSLFSSPESAGPQKKFIVVEYIGSAEDLAEEIAKRIRENEEYYIPEKSSLILLFTEYGPVKKDNPLLVLCEKEGKVSSYPKLRPMQRKAALKNMWGGKGISISGEALQYFEYCAGQDLWQASNEIEKFSTLKKGSGASITLEDLTCYLAPRQDLNAFSLVDAFSQKQRKEALILWGKLIDQGSQPLALIGALLWQIRNLLLVRAAIDEKQRVQDITGELKLHPFVARKTYGQAKYFSLEELKRLYEKVFWFDADMKRGGTDAMSGFERVVVGL